MLKYLKIFVIDNTYGGLTADETSDVQESFSRGCGSNNSVMR
jgi:hypothetical protein